MIHDIDLICFLKKHMPHTHTHVIWVGALPSNSHHQDFYIISMDPYKPSFATITGKGDNPIYNL